MRVLWLHAHVQCRHYVPRQKLSLSAPKVNKHYKSNKNYTKAQIILLHMSKIQETSKRATTNSI